MKSHRRCVFEDGTFAVITELVDKGTEELPQIVTDLVELFGINDEKKGSRYDLGCFECGQSSWIPSSKKEAGNPSGETSSGSFSPLPPKPSSGNTIVVLTTLKEICFLFVLF